MKSTPNGSMFAVWGAVLMVLYVLKKYKARARNVT